MLRLTNSKSGNGLNDWSHSAILGDRGIAARNFADLVAARMIGTVLPFSERESLVRAAARNGINRFEANLLIAAVQHQLGVGLQRQAKRGRLVSFLSSVWSTIETSCMRTRAVVRNLRQTVRQWAISKRLWPIFRSPPRLTAKCLLFVAVAQYQWELTRQWVIANRVWPILRFSSEHEAVSEAPTRNFAAMRDRPGTVRRRQPAREPARMRISSAVATFVTVQAGIIAAVWYLFAY